MDNYLNLVSILILLSSFILVANKRINSYINTFRIQSILLALLAGVMGIYSLLEEGEMEIIIVCIITFVVKVWLIPRSLRRTVKRVGYRVSKDFFLNIPTLILICCGLFVLTYFSVSTIDDIKDPQIKTYLVNSISVILIGLFFMISRKKAIGQIIGFLVMENGLFATAILTTSGMPMMVELGLFFDVLTAVLIMGILVFRINENFDSIDINKLRNLKG
ncbi:MAG TPA: NADH-quinone oxidoreductase subunit K [Pseudobacteroides sp.]|uniref:NADH-quinone oxidoreductase subunit K n=1 Tax=Pseudobacteroides sp. TaxID=1968840 RepID=UPI002F95CF7E